MAERIRIDRRADQPAYRQLADHLRGLIDTGRLAPGEPLPPESTLVTDTGLNRTTVRHAVKVLRAEGLVEAVQGRGTFVRQHRLVRQRLFDGLHTEHALVGQLPPSPGNDLWLAVTGLRAPVEVRCDYRRVIAPPDVAELLGRTAPASALRRRYRFLVAGRPHQESVSYLPWELVEGTALADPDHERVHRGTLAQLADLGVRVTAAEVSARTRMPTPAEVRRLDIGDGTPVFVIRRALLAGTGCVEMSDTTAPGDRLELAFTVGFPAPDRHPAGPDGHPGGNGSAGRRRSRTVRSG